MALTLPTKEEIRDYVRSVYLSYDSAIDLTEGSEYWIEVETKTELLYWQFQTHGKVLNRVFPDSSRDTELDRWAANFGLDDGSDGLGRIKPRVSSGDSVLAVAVTAIGVAPSGTEFTDSGNNVYQITEGIDGTVTGAGNYLADAESITKGQATNIESGTTVSLSNAPSGVTLWSTTTQADMDGAADLETDAELSGRLIDHISKPSISGNTVDITRTVESTQAGVYDAYVYPQRYTTVSGRGTNTWDTAVLQRNEIGQDKVITSAQKVLIGTTISGVLPVRSITGYRI